MDLFVSISSFNEKYYVQLLVCPLPDTLPLSLWKGFWYSPRWNYMDASSSQSFLLSCHVYHMVNLCKTHVARVREHRHTTQVLVQKMSKILMVMKEEGNAAVVKSEVCAVSEREHTCEREYVFSLARTLWLTCAFCSTFLYSPTCSRRVN